MSEEQVIGVIGITGVLRGDGTAFTEEALRGLAEKDDRFEYEEETGNLFFSTTWSEVGLRGLSWRFVGGMVRDLSMNLSRGWNKPSKKPKRFLLFAGDQFYPWGGWEDSKTSCATLEEARAEARQLKKRHHSTDFWFEIIDLETGEAIYEL